MAFCLHSFLSLHSLLSWPSVSLASVSLALFFCSSTSHLPSYPSLLSLWVTDVLPPWSLLLVLLMLWPCVVLVHLLRNSVESQFLRDGVIPLGRVISYGCSWDRSSLGHLWPVVVPPPLVLVVGSLLLLLLLVGRYFLSFSSLLWGSSPSLSS